MITTLICLVYICVLSLFYILVIPPLAPTKLFLRFLPQDIRAAGKDHPDPPRARQILGYLLTSVFSVAYLGALVFIGYDGLRRANGFWLLFGRYMLFFCGYKVFDILMQDQHIVIRKKYYLRFFPETKDCESWNDYSFNKRNQLIRLIAFPFVCALLAWITLRIGL